MNRPVFRPAPLALAIALAIGCPALHAQGANALPSDPVSLNIAAQPLGQALNDWARQTRIELIVPPALVAGKTAPAVVGHLAPRQALDRLLMGSGLSAMPDGNAMVVKTAPAATEAALQPVTVTAAAEPSPQHDGSAADGYRARMISSVGVLDGIDLRDLPFSISVMPRELIENIQAQSPDDVYKLNPSTRTIVAQGTGWSPMVGIRGFNTYDAAEDGLRRPYNHAAVMEDKERVEVLNGLSGFLYGAAAPAGIVNYVYKRPTRERLNSITTGNYGGGQYYVHGDFGGRIDEAGRAGYRLNLVKQDGRTSIDDQKIDRTLVSGALDWNLTDKLLLEVNAVYNNYKTQSPSAYWYYGVPHGNAPDARKNWSQPWIRDEFDNTKLMGRLTYQLNDQVTLRSAYTRSLVDRPVQDHTMNSVGAAGAYEQIAIHSGRTKNNFEAAQALVDVKFGTGTLAHTVTAGYFMYSTKDWGTTYNPNTGWSGPYSLATPVRLPEPVFPSDTSAPYRSGKASNNNLVIGDNIKFNEQWSALLGVTRSQITTQDFDLAGARLQADYDKSRNSPSLSLLFKPVPWLTTYASYIEGLELGGRAPDTAGNSGSLMSPMLSKQKELGVKADVGGMLLTTAVFDIEKAYEYTDGNNIYTQNGRQNHKGGEFTATGKLTRELTLLGGVTLLDTAIKGGDYDGKSPVNVAKVLAKLYAEYELPVPRLTVTGGIFHTGKQWADEANTDRLPAYTTVDLGIRYTTRASGRPLTLRLYASNIANKNYWANSHYIGAPRSVAFSAQYQF